MCLAGVKLNMETTIDLTSLSEWNQFAEERKTVLETMTILNNRHRAIVTELNQRLIERQESFQSQLVRIEDGWREKLVEAKGEIDRLKKELEESKNTIVNVRRERGARVLELKKEILNFRIVGRKIIDAHKISEVDWPAMRQLEMALIPQRF